jgi:hypothetical protein
MKEIIDNLIKVSIGFVFGSILLMFIGEMNVWVISLIQMIFFTSLYSVLDILLNKIKKKMRKKKHDTYN